MSQANEGQQQPREIPPHIIEAHNNIMAEIHWYVYNFPNPEITSGWQTEVPKEVRVQKILQLYVPVLFVLKAAYTNML